MTSPEQAQRRRYALVGTGNRGTTMWGKNLLAGWAEQVELVGLADTNEMRAAEARKIIGSNAPIYGDFGQLLAEQKPDLAIVCTPDYTHDDMIVQALESGADVISEKPMATTPEKIRRIIEAEKRTGRRVDVSFNYRFSPTAAKVKSLLLEGAIGTVSSVDFHWYLNTDHGADYFRRWHAFKAKSGSLFVHKATHHFDLLNWYLATEPETVSAFGELRNYGKAGPFRSVRCKGCPYARDCNYYMDLEADPFLEQLYEAPSAVDGYFRDACVYREDIDIPDTMVATIQYRNKVVASYSVNTFMPIEGHAIAFNGTGGRIELRQYEKQPWETPPSDEILLIRNFDGVERITVQHAEGGHYGGDNLMRNMIFKGDKPDTLGQRAGSRAGAMSVLCGVAAMESVTTGRKVKIEDIFPEAWQ